MLHFYLRNKFEYSQPSKDSFVSGDFQPKMIQSHVHGTCMHVGGRERGEVGEGGGRGRATQGEEGTGGGGR